MTFLPPANVVCEGYIFTGVCDSVNRGACVVARGGWGACVVALGGMHGCSGGACVVALGGAWFLWGDMRGFFRGVRGFSLGGMHGVSRGACVVFPRGACVGYNEIRSMSGRYASYWNGFLLQLE